MPAETAIRERKERRRGHPNKLFYECAIMEIDREDAWLSYNNLAI
jgi:hypothetical protein